MSLEADFLQESQISYDAKRYICVSNRSALFDLALVGHALFGLSSEAAVVGPFQQGRGRFEFWVAVSELPFLGCRQTPSLGRRVCLSVAVAHSDDGFLPVSLVSRLGCGVRKQRGKLASTNRLGGSKK